MNLVNLIAELQTHPRSTAIYRKILKSYQDRSMLREVEAFRALLKEKFNVEDSPPNQEQRDDNTQDAGINPAMRRTDPNS
jgi:hypothetical protein